MQINEEKKRKQRRSRQFREAKGEIDCQKNQGSACQKTNFRTSKEEKTFPTMKFD